MTEERLAGVPLVQNDVSFVLQPMQSRLLGAPHQVLP